MLYSIEFNERLSSNCMKHHNIIQTENKLFIINDKIRFIIVQNH